MRNGFVSIIIKKTFRESLSTIRDGARFKTRLSSAGLVWTHFGPKIIAEILKLHQTDPLIPVLFEKMYERFFEEIDAIDNGIDQYDREPGKEPKYAITTTLSNRISFLNPWWNSENKDETAAFQKAMKLVGSEFLDRLGYFHKCWWPARDLVQKAINSRFEIDPSGSIMNFGDEGGFPWKEHLFELESELKIVGQLKFVLFKDTANSNWRVQAVPLDTKTFELRLSLPAEWCGLRDEELAKVSGIPGTVFCHGAGFIGGHANYEGVLEMARRALKSTKKTENAEVTKNGAA